MEERLHKFVCLVDVGNFVRAARELHVSQPALSVAVAKLERELRAPLFVHGVRPLTLTSAGKLAYVAGKEIALNTNNLKTSLAELAQRKVAVSVGMIDSVAGALFASTDSVDELERSASVSLVVDNSRNLLAAAENGKLDLVFVVGQRGYGRTLETVHRSVEPLVVVCAAAQLVASNRALRAGTLPRFISYDQASTTHRLVASALQERNITPDTTFYSTSPEVMLRLVLQQKGVAALPYLLVQSAITSGELQIVGGVKRLVIERPIHAVKLRGTVLPGPLTAIAERLDGLLATGV